MLRWAVFLKARRSICVTFLRGSAKWNGICYLYFDALDWGPADPVEEENWDSLSRCCIDLFNLTTSARKTGKDCLRVRKEFGRLDSELSSLIGIRTRFKIFLDDSQKNLHE